MAVCARKQSLFVCTIDADVSAVVFFLVTRTQSSEQTDLSDKTGSLRLSGMPLDAPTSAYSDLPSKGPQTSAGVHVLPFGQGGTFQIELRRESEVEVDINDSVKQ